MAALASPKRLQVLEWLRDPRAHFPPQRDGDLIDDGVCVLFIANKLGVAQPTATAHMQALARPIGQVPQQRQPGMRHDTLTAPGYLQPLDHPVMCTQKVLLELGTPRTSNTLTVPAQEHFSR